MFRAGGWSDLTVWLTKADILAVHSEFISRRTCGMPEGYSFGSAPSLGRKKSTKPARVLGGGTLAFLPSPFFARWEVPRIVARESNSCSGVSGLIVMEA